MPQTRITKNVQTNHNLTSQSTIHESQQDLSLRAKDYKTPPSITNSNIILSLRLTRARGSPSVKAAVNPRRARGGSLGWGSQRWHRELRTWRRAG